MWDILCNDKLHVALIKSELLKYKRKPMNLMDEMTNREWHAESIDIIVSNSNNIVLFIEAHALYFFSIEVSFWYNKFEQPARNAKFPGSCRNLYWQIERFISSLWNLTKNEIGICQSSFLNHIHYLSSTQSQKDNSMNTYSFSNRLHYLRQWKSARELHYLTIATASLLLQVFCLVCLAFPFLPFSH